MYTTYNEKKHKGELKDDDETEYQEHQARKDQARKKSKKTSLNPAFPSWSI